MRIILDMDQIICAWSQRIIEWWNADHGTSLTVNDIKSWDVGKWLGPNAEHFVRSCCRYPEFYRDLDPIEGAIEGTKKLIESGHDVVIATFVPPSAAIAYSGKIEWIRRRMPFFPTNNFIAIKRKDLLTGDILFDDGAHNIVAWNASKRPAVVMDTSWNQDIPNLTGWRVKHWNEFLHIIEEFDTAIEMMKQERPDGL